MTKHTEQYSNGTNWGPHLAAAAFVICTAGGTASASTSAAPLSASTNNVVLQKQLQTDRGPRLQRKRLDSSSSTIPDKSEQASLTFASQWVSSIVSQLLELVHLEDNWNGDGALPVHQQVVDRLELFCWVLPPYVPAPTVKVGAEGNAGLYWDSSEGYLEIDVIPSGEFLIYHADSNHEPIAYHEVRTMDDALGHVLHEWSRHLEMESLAIAA